MVEILLLAQMETGPVNLLHHISVDNDLDSGTRAIRNVILYVCHTAITFTTECYYYKHIRQK